MALGMLTVVNGYQWFHHLGSDSELLNSTESEKVPILGWQPSPNICQNKHNSQNKIE